MSSQPQHSRTPTLHFGQVNRDNIEEGKELYTRKDLYQFGGHGSESKDVHGNMKDGCDSIVVGNLVSPYGMLIFAKRETLISHANNDTLDVQQFCCT